MCVCVGGGGLSLILGWVGESDISACLDMLQQVQRGQTDGHMMPGEFNNTTN